MRTDGQRQKSKEKKKQPFCSDGDVWCSLASLRLNYLPVNYSADIEECTDQRSLIHLLSHYAARAIRDSSRARARAARRRPASTDHPFLFRFLWPTLWRRPADNAVDASCTIHNWTNTDFFFWRPTNKKDKSQFKVWNQSLFRCLWLGKLGPIFFPSFLLPTDDEKKSQASIFENHRHIPSFFSSSSPSHSTNDYLKRERERRTVWVSYIVFFLFRS